MKKKEELYMEKLYNENCLKVLKTIEDDTIDLIVTDCPYHIVKGGCTNIKNGITWNKENSKTGKLFEYNEIDFSEWLPDTYRILKDGGHCYIMINGRNLAKLQTEAEKCGFIFQQLLVWDKGNATPNRYYLNACEFILMLRKGKAKNINNMKCKNIINIKNVKNKKHPTEKPIELMQLLIENSSKTGEIVLDPFMGAGSTGLACLNCERDFIGIEIDEKYYKIAEERLQKQ